MADLSELFKVAPNVAGFMVGGQNRQAREQHELKQQELAQILQGLKQAQAQDADMHPLKLEHQRGLNAAQGATLPGLQATSQKLGYEAQQKGATLPEAIAADRSKYNLSAQQDKGKMAGEVSNFFVTTAQKLRGIPPLQRMQTLTQELQSAGLDPQSPQVQSWLKILGEKDPEQMPDVAMSLASMFGKAAAQGNAGYHQAIEVGAATNKTNLERERMQQEGLLARERLSQAGQNQRSENKAKNKGTPDFWGNYYTKLKTSRDRHGALIAEAYKIGTDTDEAKVMLRMAEAIRPQAEAETARVNPPAGSPDLPALGVQAVPQGSIAPPPPGGRPSAPGQATPPTGKTRSGASYTIIKE